MSYDSGFSDRMNHLVDLMTDPKNQNKPMKKLQWSAFRMYPMYSREALRWWMGSRIAMMAAEWAHKRESSEKGQQKDD